MGTQDPINCILLTRGEEVMGREGWGTPEGSCAILGQSHPHLEAKQRPGWELSRRGTSPKQSQHSVPFCFLKPNNEAPS